MRVCDDCGASAGDNMACSQCGAPAPPAAWPPVAEPRNSVPAARGWPEVSPPPPAVAPVEPPPRAPRRKRTGTLVAIGLVAVVIAGAIVAFVATRGDDDAVTTPNIVWARYRSQDGRVSVRMPSAPNVTPLPAPLKGAIAAATVPSWSDRLFLEVQRGPVAAAQVRSTLRAHATLAIAIAGAKLVKVTDTKFRGYPAVRGTGSSNGDPVEFLAFAVGDSEYALVVQSVHVAAVDLQTFADSLQLDR